MKKLLLFIGLLFSFIVPIALTSSPVLAAEFNSQIDQCQNLSDSEFCQQSTNAENKLFGPNGIMTKVITFLNLTVGVVAVFMIIIAGLRLINSSGEPQKVASAKNTIIYGAVGIAIAAFSQAIVAFVVTNL